MTLRVPSGWTFSQVTANRPWPSMDTRGEYEFWVVKSTMIGAPVGWPALSNCCAQMSWSEGEYALTQTATEAPLEELATAEAALSVAWGLKLAWCSGPRSDSRARPSRASRAGRRRRERRGWGAAAERAAVVPSGRVKNRRIMGIISVGEG